MSKISFRNDVLPLKNVLYRMALRITMDAAEAEDIVQDTLVKVWNRRDTWDEIDSIEAFSLTICRNLALDRIKRADRRNTSLDRPDMDAEDHSSNPLEQTSMNDRIAMIKDFVDRLPEKQKSCMQLRDFEGKSYKDIAGILDISESQVKVNLFRARQAVREQLIEIENYGL